MGQLATQVGLSRATLCCYFASREAMMLEIFQKGVSCAERAIERARLHKDRADQAIMRVIQELLPIVERCRPPWNRFLTEADLCSRAFGDYAVCWCSAVKWRQWHETRNSRIFFGHVLVG